MVGKPFEKGRSGNPGGRPKENQEVKELARKHTKAAINRLEYWMNSDNAKASVAASQALLDRGHGKPKQEIEATGHMTFESVLDRVAQAEVEGKV